jgi:PAS domain S-box-containing protein
MIGYDRKELCEYSFPNPFWPEEFYKNAKEDIINYQQIGLLKIETYFCRKNNTHFPVSLSGSIIENKVTNELEYLFLIEDISEQRKEKDELKLSQEMLVTLNNKLEELVRKRTDQLKKVMKQKNEFIKQLGHDLKNPLTPLNGLLPIIIEKEKDPEIKESLQIFYNSAKYMHSLIINTIEFAKIDSPHITFSFEIVDLKQEIDTIIKNNFSFMKENNIGIINQINDDIKIEIDTIRFNELITNLISNSIKFSKDNGFVYINATKKENDFVMLDIIDNGIGMTDEQLQNVFMEFYTVKKPKSTLKSSGLGMSICKRIVERHGGSITCKSEGLGKGTIVNCLLPLRQKLKLDDEFDKEMKEVFSLNN